MNKSSSRQSLEARIKELERERDYYLKAIHLLMPRKVKRLSAQQALQLKNGSVPFEQVIADVESIVKG